MNFCVITASIPGVISASDSASLAAKAIRTADPTLKRTDVISLPLVDGGAGTLEQLVSSTVGSFIEVEATGGDGKQSVVPLGLTGSDPTLGAVELGSFLRAQSTTGTSLGLGEVIQDLIDENAFSIIIGVDAGLVRDAGLGAVQAMGVKFLDGNGNLVDLAVPEEGKLSRIENVDFSGRPFDMMSRRFFFARSAEALKTSADADYDAEIGRIGTIIKRDCGIVCPALETLSESRVEFGIATFFNAKLRDGKELLFEAQGIEAKLEAAEGLHILVIDESGESVNLPLVKKLLLSANALEVTSMCWRSAAKPKQRKVRHLSFEDAPLFLAPLAPGAGKTELRRDFQMRLEALVSKKLFSPVVASAE